MPNNILNSETYHEEIRSRLGVGADIVSDADIDAPSVLPIAEDRIIEMVPDYETATDKKERYIYAAAICMVAAILAHSMNVRIRKAKKDFDFTIENFATDWGQLKKMLMEEIEGLIGSITDDEGSTKQMLDFAGPTRLKESRCRR
ncbi:hypothetical protein ACX93W_05235 [Paenibacillus sp. CAU 1782]